MTSKSKAPEAVEATVIETDVTTLSSSEEWLAQIRERAEQFAERFAPAEVTTETEYKASKRKRADANREIKAIEQERRNMTAAIKRAVREFEEGSKLATEPLSEVVAEYDRFNDAYLERWVEERKDVLREEYETFAPDLVPLAPFERLLERYGSEKGTGWLLRGTSEADAIASLQTAVEDVARAEKTIDSMVEEGYRETAKARYFLTLDLQATLSEEAEAKAQRERVARLEAERQERIAAEEEARRQAEAVQAPERQAEPEPACYEPAEAIQAATTPPPEPAGEPAEIDMGEVTPGNTERVYHDVPVPPAQATPLSQPAPPAPPAASAERAWVVEIPSATRDQMRALAAMLKQMGLTGTIRPKEAAHA